MQTTQILPKSLKRVKEIRTNTLAIVIGKVIASNIIGLPIGETGFRVFEILASMAGLPINEKDNQHGCPLFDQMWNIGDHPIYKRESELAAILTSDEEIIRAASLDDNLKGERLSEILILLSCIRELATMPSGYGTGMQLISFSYDLDTGQIRVGINRRIASALFSDPEKFRRKP